MCSDLQSADASLAFNHIKDGRPFPAQILPTSCTARTIIYCEIDGQEISAREFANRYPKEFKEE
jgi:hypothetical protein